MKTENCCIYSSLHRSCFKTEGQIKVELKQGISKNNSTFLVGSREVSSTAVVPLTQEENIFVALSLVWPFP